MDPQERERFIDEIGEVTRKLKLVHRNWTRQDSNFRILEGVTEETEQALLRMLQAVRDYKTDNFVKEKITGLANLAEMLQNRYRSRTTSRSMKEESPDTLCIYGTRNNLPKCMNNKNNQYPVSKTN